MERVRAEGSNHLETARLDATRDGSDAQADVIDALADAQAGCPELLRLRAARRITEPENRARQGGGVFVVRFIIEEWILLEYAACCFLPAQQNAVVEQVGKSLSKDFAKALGLGAGALVPGPLTVEAFTPWEEIEKSI